MCFYCRDDINEIQGILEHFKTVAGLWIHLANYQHTRIYRLISRSLSATHNGIMGKDREGERQKVRGREILL